MKKIKNIFQHFLQKKIIKVSFSNATQVLLRFVLGLLNIKIISTWLGASGMVLLGQFNSFTQIISNFSGVGIQHGVTKLCAQYKKSNNSYLIIGNSIFLIIVLSTISSLLVYVFSSKISLYILHSLEFTNYIRITGLLALSLSFNNLILSIFNGFENYKIYVKANIIFALTTFSISIPFIYFLNLNGAISAIFVASVFNSLISLYYFRKLFIPVFQHFKFSLYVNKRLLSFGLMLIIASFISHFSSILIRNVIISEYSLTMAGWWEGVSRISKNIFSLSIAALSLYYLPNISKSQSSKDLNKLIWNSIKITFPVFFIGTSIVYFFRNTIVDILFSPTFKGMENLFLYQNIGDAIRIFNWYFAITLIIKEKTTIYIVSEVLMAVIYYILIYTIIPRVGIENSTLPYMINTVIYLFLSQFLYRKYII